MKKSLSILFGIIMLAGCSSVQISDKSYLEYKDLYCNKFIGSSGEIGLLERSSESITTTEQNQKYIDYISSLKEIPLPSQYKEYKSAISKLLNQKISLGKEFENASMNFEVRYPNTSLYYSCFDLGLGDDCIDGTKEAYEYYESLFDPLTKELRSINAKMLVTHDKLFIKAKEELSIEDQQYMCGENESGIRILFETY